MFCSLPWEQFALQRVGLDPAAERLDFVHELIDIIEPSMD